MQQIKSLTILFIFAVLLISCGGQESTVSTLVSDGDIEAIRAKKAELTAQQKTIADDIALLDSAIIASTGGANLPLITALKLNSEDFIHYIDLQGDVTTRQNVLVYPEMAGTMNRVFVEEGDYVKKDQLLASIDDGGMSSQLVLMKTQLSLAETTYERQKS